VAIHQRSDQAAVNVIRNAAGVVVARFELADALLPFPIAFDLVAVGVEAAATVTVGEIVRVKVLKGLGHKYS
jgi:hypothetical protein